MYIYEEIGTQAVIIQQLCAFQTTQKGIFLHYHHDVNDPKNLTAHYDAIVDIPPPPGQLPNDEDNLEVTCNSPNPVTSSEYQTCTINTAYTTDLNENQSFGEVFADREVSATPYMPGSRCKRVKGSKGKLNLNLFEGMVPESVDKMPWNANGNSIYVILTTEEYWHDKQLDGRHWIFTTSSKKGLNGIRKFGTCQGSLICMNPECPTWTTEQVCNEVDFKNEEYGTYSCNCCGVLFSCKFCGAHKVTEFNRRTNLMTIWHQGQHICKLQPNVHHQDEILQKKAAGDPQ